MEEAIELLLCFLISKKHGRNHIRKIARHDGSHAAHVTGTAFEVYTITSLSS